MNKGNVIVVSAESTRSFYVLHEDLIPLEEKFQQSIQKIAEKQPKPSKVKPNQRYLAKVEGSWRRVLVQSLLEDNKCEVLFVDFGSTGTVQKAYLKKCDTFLEHQREKVTKCSLQLPSEVTEHLKADEVFKLMVSKKQTFKMVIKEVVDASLFIDLITLNRHQNFSIVEFFLSSAGQAVSIETLSVPIEAFPIKSFELNPNDQIVAVSVRDIVSPLDFHVSLEDLKCEEVVMGIEMQEFYKSSSVFFVLLVPGVFCATEDEFRVWHRAEVLTAPNAEGFCEVQLIDTGKKEKLKWHCLYELDQQFYNFPKYALNCFLNGVNPRTAEAWQDSEIDFFSNCVCNVEVQLKKAADGVQLFVIEKEISINVNRLLVLVNMARGSAEICADTLYTRVEDSTDISQKCHEVAVFHRKNFNPREIRVCFREFEQGVVILNSLIQNVNNERETTWKTGDACLVHAKSKAGKFWYRGRISSLNVTKALYKVKLLDTEAELDAPSTKLHSCPEIYRNVGSSIISVRLACDSIKPWTKQDKEDVSNLLRSYDKYFITFKDNNSILFNTYQKDPRPVSFWGLKDGMRHNIIREFEKLALVRAMYNEPDVLSLESEHLELLDYVEQVEDNDELREGVAAFVGDIKIDLVKRIVDDWKPATPIQSRNFFAAATYVNDSGEIVLHDNQLSSRLDDMNDLINVHFKGIPSTKHDFKVGDPCLALFENDALYYRARIVSLHGARCSVEFIDYGNICKDVNTKRLFHHVICSEIPSFANKYRLYDLPMKDGEIDQAFLTVLHRQICEKTIEVRVDKTDINSEDIVKRCAIVVDGYLLKTYDDLKSLVD